MITNFLIHSSKHYPTKTALIFENTKISYSELNQKSQSLAKSLRKIDSDVISLLLPNGIDFCISYFGILYSGKVCHIIPTSISDSNLAIQITLTKSNTIISNSIFKKKLSRTNLLHNCLFLDVDSFDYEENDSSLLTIEPSSDAMILFSAGTTSNPKGVKLSHANVVNTVNRVSNYLKISNIDIDVICLPLSHSFGLGCLNCIIRSGGTAILHKNTLNMPEIIHSIKNYQATSFASTPTTFQNIINNHKSLFQTSIDSIRYLLTNSSPMQPTLTNSILDILDNKKLYTYYGLTEASRSTFHLYKKNDEKIKSVGKPLPEVIVKIFTNSHECTAMETGEICIKGPHVSSGYITNTVTEHTSDGWLHTGDIGYFDNDGYLFLVGRKDDLINVGGEKVFPKEIEDILINLEGIEDIAIKGIFDASLGQIVKAFVVCKIGTNITDNDLFSFCRGKMENYKIPRIIEYLPKLPKNEQGKLLRHKL